MVEPSLYWSCAWNLFLLPWSNHGRAVHLCPVIRRIYRYQPLLLSTTGICHTWLCPYMMVPFLCFYTELLMEAPASGGCSPQSLNLNCPWCSVSTLSLYKFYWGSVIPEHNQTMIANLNKCIIILIVAFIQKHVKNVVHHLLHKPPAELIPLIPLILFFFINLYNFNMCAAREKKWQTINCKATWDSLKLTQKTWIV